MSIEDIVLIFLIAFILGLVVGVIITRTPNYH